MRSIFLCEDDLIIKKVFPDYIIETLKIKSGLEENVYSRSDLLRDCGDFKDVEYIFSTWGMPKLSEEEIKTILPSLKCVFYAAGTVQSFARPFLNCGVKVFSAWAANAVPVAEYTVAQIILANKGFYKNCTISSKEEYYKMREELDKYGGNYNAKIGIIGAGMIGKLVIKMLKNYKLDVLVFDPFLPNDNAKELGVNKVGLEELFKQCNVISNHLANNAQTQGILNYNHFASMPPYSTFLNTGRGAQVVEADLVKVLHERPDIFSVLDVTDPEPCEDTHEFYTLPNCILTTHIAGSAGKEVHRMAEYMLIEFENFICGKPCEYEVSLKMLETMA